MAKKKSGYSKKSKDWLGRTVIDHYNDKGKKTGYSKGTKDFWGNSVTERFNARGDKTGYNKQAKTFWGNDITERFNSKGEKVGLNKKSRTFWGTPVTKRYNSAGEKIGHSVKEITFWGTPITQHYDDSTPSSYIPQRGGSGDSGDYSSSAETTTGSSGSGWLWFLGIVIVFGIALLYGVLDSMVVRPPSSPVASDAPPTPTPDVPQPVRPYEPTKFVSRDAQTGLITIDTTVDGLGTVEGGWNTVITGGMKRQVFLRKDDPVVDIGDRLRITYDQHVPEEFQRQHGTGGRLNGVIGSIMIIRHEDSAGRTSFPKVLIDNKSYLPRLLPVDGGVEDASFSEFRNDLMAAVARKDSSFLASVLAPDIKVGFGSEPDNSSEFQRVWRTEAPDSQIWTKLDEVLRLGGRFEVFNGERKFCAPYLFCSWPDNFDAFSYVAIIATNVQLRSEPDDNSQSLARLSYNVLRFVDWTPDRQWAHVTMADGTSGFVAVEYVRSPIDYRATFRQLDGKWMIAAFVAGD